MAQITITNSFIYDKIEDFNFSKNKFKDINIKKTKKIFNNFPPKKLLEQKDQI